MCTLPPTPDSTFLMGSVLSTLSIDYYHNFTYKFSLDISSDEEDFETFLPILSTIGVPNVTISNGSDTEWYTKMLQIVVTL